MSDQSAGRKSVWPDLAALLGLALLSYGAWRAWPPAGFIVAGVLLLVFAIVAGAARG